MTTIQYYTITDRKLSILCLLNFLIILSELPDNISAQSKLKLFLSSPSIDVKTGLRIRIPRLDDKNAA